MISITGKKHLSRVYFEGEIIDGVNHTFTSTLSANCESLDLYFWSRFPSFKDIESLKELKGDHSSKYIYMRWTERGSLKTKLTKKKKINFFFSNFCVIFKEKKITVQKNLKKQIMRPFFTFENF